MEYFCQGKGGARRTCMLPLTAPDAFPCWTLVCMYAHKATS